MTLHNRREFLGLSTAATIMCFATPAVSAAVNARKLVSGGSYFVQMSDTHWGYGDVEFKRQSAELFTRAFGLINEFEPSPDFIIFTGDLIHSSHDPGMRERRLAEFKELTQALRVKDRLFIPGEHDASLDAGAAFRKVFGQTHFAFNHKGVHFIALDNASNPAGTIGDEQLNWMENDLRPFAPEQPVVVLTHRPLFNLCARWDWSTRDGAHALELLRRFRDASVFYGHIHHERRSITANISHFSAKSLSFTFSEPGVGSCRQPVPSWAIDSDQAFGFHVRTLGSGSCRELLPSGRVACETSGGASNNLVRRNERA